MCAVVAFHDALLIQYHAFRRACAIFLLGCIIAALVLVMAPFESMV